MQKVSLTDNTPSVLNGALDLCDLSQAAGAADVDRMKENVRALLGDPAVAYIDLVILEYSFVRREYDPISLASAVNEIYMTADSLGKPDLSFAAIGVMTRHLISQGKMRVALEQLDSFRSRMILKNQTDIAKSVETMHMHMSLIGGDSEEARRWLITAPDTTVNFTFLDRYQYINKLRVLILLGRYEEALALSGRLRVMFTEYGRSYYRIQNQVMRAILLYRMKDSNWMEELDQALSMAEHYGFYDMVAAEGAALLPLLDFFTPVTTSKTYLKHARQQVEQFAKHYPSYLVMVEPLKTPLTESEHTVVRLLCHDMPSEEICETLHITYSGLKFHKQNIYRKLDARNQKEAVQKAKSLGLNLQ